MTYYVFYDLDQAPATFNVFHTLISAEFARRAVAPDSNIHFVFVPGKDQGFKSHRVVRPEEYWWRARSILFPAVDLLPSCTGFTMLPDRPSVNAFVERAGDLRFPLNYTEPNAAACCRHTTLSLNYGLGYDMPAIRAPKMAREYIASVIEARCSGQPVVVLSLRQAPYSVERNSDLDVWSKVIDYLRDKGAYIFLLPEYEDVFGKDELSRDGVEVYDGAVLNLHLRVALFERADLLIGQGGGAMMPALISPETNYISVRTHVEEFGASTTEKMKEHGWRIGKDPNYYGNYVKWLWSEENADQIIAACDQYFDVYANTGEVNVAERMDRIDMLEALTDHLGADAIRTIIQEYGPSKKGPVFVNKERQANGKDEFTIRVLA